MSDRDQAYHRDREQQCRALAHNASDPDVRRRHEELAELHAGRAAALTGGGANSAELSAA
jgi:hypothetical protein